MCVWEYRSKGLELGSGVTTFCAEGAGG